MSDQTMPFVCIKNGWSLNIRPRTAFGWIATLVWIAIHLGPTALFVCLMSRDPSDAKIAAYVTGYVLFTLGWTLAMLRWMYVRSTVIDLKAPDKPARR